MNQSAKTAVFLGAGASAAEGAPMQSALFRDYFAIIKNQQVAETNPDSALQMKDELGNFFQSMFDININVDEKTLGKTEFPTFEEALGILDLAELRRESLRKFQSDTIGPNSNRIRRVRQYIVLAMADIIARKLKEPAGNKPHKILVRNLKSKNLLKDTVFISANYDVLIDNALNNLSPGSPGKMVDYGLEFNYAINESTKWKSPSPTATKLFKLHGSLNWLYCPTCNGIAITRGKGVIKLITNVEGANCNVCHSVLAPIIVPPTFYKDMSRVFLSVVWNKAENALRGVNHIIFCGYSFPDAHIHIKYLIKRIQTNRENEPIRFTVVSHHAGKTKKQALEEKSRYVRFLGKNLAFTAHGFDDFANNPTKFYQGLNLKLI